MSILFKNRPCFWINPSAQDAAASFSIHLKNSLFKSCPRTALYRNPLVFLCIGTPLLAGDSLGPLIGTALKNQGIPHVYGTLVHPVHAENIETYRRIIKKRYRHPTIIAIDAAIGTKEQEGFITIRRGALRPGSGLGKKIPPYRHPTIIAIDAAIGTKEQEGFITIRRGALRPGSGLGKKIPPIGNIEITGIFEDIEKQSNAHLAGNLSRIIAAGITNFIFYSSFQHVLNTK